VLFADVYVFDDPLSALDAEVGRALFERCIVGELGSKTRLLVTNQLQYLRHCDGVLVLSKDEVHRGVIKHQGTFDELMQVKEFSDMMAAYGHDHSSSSRSEEPEDGPDTVIKSPAASVAAGDAITTQKSARSAKVSTPKAAAAADTNNQEGGEVGRRGVVPVLHALLYCRRMGETHVVHAAGCLHVRPDGPADLAMVADVLDL
jgi:ATP-binding cassette subfamily C (CFTR/MRP) protein 1